MSRRHRARWTWGIGLALMLVAGAVGGKLALSGSRPQVVGLRAFALLPYPPANLHFDAARHLIVATYGNDLPHTNRVVVIDARSGRILHSTDVGPYVAQGLAVDFRTQRALAFSGFPHAQADLIDIRTGRITQVIGLPLAPMAVAVDAETGDAVVSGSLSQGGAPALALMDIASGQVVRVVKLRGRAGSGAGPIAFDDTTHRILVSSQGGLNLLDARTGTPLAYTPLTAGGSPDRIAVDRQTHQAFVALLNSPAPGSSCARGCTQTVGAFAIVDDRTGRLLRPRVIVLAQPTLGRSASQGARTGCL